MMSLVRTQRLERYLCTGYEKHFLIESSTARWTEAKFWTKHDFSSIAMRERAELAASNSEQTWSRGPK